MSDTWTLGVIDFNGGSYQLAAAGAFGGIGYSPDAEDDGWTLPVGVEAVFLQRDGMFSTALDFSDVDQAGGAAYAVLTADGTGFDLYGSNGAVIKSFSVAFSGTDGYAAYVGGGGGGGGGGGEAGEPGTFAGVAFPVDPSSVVVAIAGAAALAFILGVAVPIAFRFLRRVSRRVAGGVG